MNGSIFILIISEVWYVFRADIPDMLRENVFFVIAILSSLAAFP